MSELWGFNLPLVDSRGILKPVGWHMPTHFAVPTEVSMHVWVVGSHNAMVHLRLDLEPVKWHAPEHCAQPTEVSMHVCFERCRNAMVLSRVYLKHVG